MLPRAPWLVFASLVLAACSKPDAPAPRDAAVAHTTTFTKAPPVVGAKRLESSDLAMTVAITVDGQKKDTTIGESVKHTDEVLAVSGGAITKVRVTFDEVKSTEQSTAIRGKTYEVAAKDGTIDVRGANGEPVTPAEAREVLRQEKNLGRPDPMLAALPASGVVPGQKVDAIADAIRRQLEDSGEAMTVKDVVVTFREARGDDAVFAVALTLVKDDGAMTMEVALNGEAFVSTKTGASTKLHLAGPVTLRGHDGVEAAGTGRMELATETRAL